MTEGHTELAAVAKKASKSREIVRSRNDQNLTNAREHEHAHRVVDHGFVVDGEELLADRKSAGMQTGPGSTGEDDAFHGKVGEKEGDQARRVVTGSRRSQT